MSNEVREFDISLKTPEGRRTVHCTITERYIIDYGGNSRFQSQHIRMESGKSTIWQYLNPLALEGLELKHDEYALAEFLEINGSLEKAEMKDNRLVQSDSVVVKGKVFPRTKGSKRLVNDAICFQVGTQWHVARSYADEIMAEVLGTRRWNLGELVNNPYRLDHSDK